MPWNGKRRVQPLHEFSKCVCSECDGLCPDPATDVHGKSVSRCEECWATDGRHPTNTSGDLHWYCAAAGHRDDLCGTWDDHREKVGRAALGVAQMLRTLDHAMEMGKSRQETGQVSLWEEA